MKARVLHLDSDEHGAVQAVLPWYANGTLDAAERAEVEAHLGDCARCRADLEFQRHLRATPAREALPGEVDRGWLALRAAHRGPGGGARPARRRRTTGAARRAGGRSRSALAGGVRRRADGRLGLALPAATRRLPHPRRRRPPPAANALVVFRPDATEAEMRRALRAADARVVGGPTVTDAYLLRIPALGAASLARLRAEPARDAGRVARGRAGAMKALLVAVALFGFIANASAADAASPATADPRASGARAPRPAASALPRRRQLRERLRRRERPRGAPADRGGARRTARPRPSHRVADAARRPRLLRHGGARRARRRRRWRGAERRAGRRLGTGDERVPAARATTIRCTRCSPPPRPGVSTSCIAARPAATSASR